MGKQAPITDENIQKFLDSGGKIKVGFTQDDRFAKHNSRYRRIESIGTFTIANAFASGGVRTKRHSPDWQQQLGHIGSKQDRSNSRKEGK